MVCNPILFFVFALWSVRKKRKEYDMVYPVAVLILGMSTLLLILEFSLVGVIYRYLGDFSAMLFLAAAITVFLLYENTDNTQLKQILVKTVIGCVVVSVVYNLLLFIVPNLKYPLNLGNTELYYRILYAFRII